MGAQAATHAVGGLLSSAEKNEGRLRQLLASQAELLVNEFGRLKGTVMKAGQSLSVMGEYFLPPEVNRVLKTLQSDSPPVEWSEMAKILRKRLPPETLAQLEIDPEPVAAASLGQVHRATVKATGETLALKIQYPGVDKSIDSDLNSIRSILSMTKFLSDSTRIDQLFTEVRTMLKQETNYEIEASLTQEYASRLASAPGADRFVVPKLFPQFSGKKLLATSFEHGVAIDSPEVNALSADRRNALGEAFLDLYFREFLSWGMVQTDPHFGNYRVRLGQGPAGTPGGDQIVLFDFGAVRKFEPAFIAAYKKLIRGCEAYDLGRIVEGAAEIGFLRPDDPEETRVLFAEVCTLIMEGFFDPAPESKDARVFREAGLSREYFNPQTGRYRWGKSDLPKRVATKGPKLVMAFRLRPPPPEIVFLDRKLGGVFIFLSKLDCELPARKLLDQYL